MMPKSTRDVAPGSPATHQDVAGVHVGVEEAVAEHLGEEDLDAVARELRDVDAGVAQALDLADRDAVHALHHHHVAVAVVPVHLRHHAAAASPRSCAAAGEQLAASRIRSSSSCRCFSNSATTSRGLQAPAVGEQRLDQPGGGVRAAPRPARSPARCRGAAPSPRRRGAVVQAGEMHLRDRAPRPPASRRSSANTSASGFRYARSSVAIGLARTGRAAPGPAAAPVRRRCRAAPGRAGSTASART